MARRLITLICTLFLLVQQSVLKAQPYCDVRTFNIRDGLAANIISGIGQTPDGLMWFSTWNGLCCYDGYRFTTFRDEAGSKEVLSSNRIAAISPNSRGDIWCITFDRILYLFDTRQCRFVNVSNIISQKYGQPFRARNLYSLPNGHTWVTIEEQQGATFRLDDNRPTDADGITIFALNGKQLKGVNVKKVVEAGSEEVVVTEGGTQLVKANILSSQVYEYVEEVGGQIFMASTDGQLATYAKGMSRLKPVPLPGEVKNIYQMQQLDDQLLLATNAGLVVFNPSTKAQHTVGLQSPTHPSAQITNLFVDSRKRLWIFTDSQDIALMATLKAQPRWIPLRQTPGFQPTRSEQPLWVEDHHGTIWAIPPKGVFCYYDEKEDQMVPYQLKSEGYEFANIPVITKFHVDQQRNVWLSSTHDLSLLHFKYRQFQHVTVSSHEETRALCIDHANRLWMGDGSGHIALFNTALQRQGYLNPNGHVTPVAVAFPGRIYYMFEDNRQRLWIGTKGNGLYLLEKEGRLSHYLPDDDIYAIDQDEQGNLWVGSYRNGLRLVNEQASGITFTAIDPATANYPAGKYNRIRRITHDGKGTVLLSTTDGLVSFSNRFESLKKMTFYCNTHLTGDTTSLLTSDVLQTHISQTGRVFVATLGGGMQELQGNSLLSNQLKFRRLSMFLPEEGNCLSMVEDGSGKLWVVRETTVNRFDPTTGTVEQYGPSDLSEHTEFSEALPVNHAATGRICLGSMGGFVTFMPDALKRSSQAPRIIFTGIQYQGETTIHPILNTEELSVDNHQRNFTINFAALDYANNDLVRYAYKIEGIDKAWNYVGQAHSASFNRFPAGRYRLLVKSTNSEGAWVDNMVALNIYAHPTFWETWWAWLLYAALLALVVYTVAHIYMLRRKAQMERQLSELKTQFYTDVSHKLRTPLTLIGGPVTEVLKDESTLSHQGRSHLEMVRRNAVHMLELVNGMLKYSKEHQAYVTPTHLDTEEENLMATGSTAPAENPENQQSPTATTAPVRLLIVEDNDDLRTFLMSILTVNYDVLAAANGKEGLLMAQQEQPDFIITDVTMPEMDGLTMVHHIKADKDICHIPIIVLSARASLEDQLQGLREGIDDYITKPFSATYLKQRVENIISQRRMLQQTYLERIRPEAVVAPVETPAEVLEQPVPEMEAPRLSSPKIVDYDQDMMDKLLKYIEAHLADTDLKIEDLAEAVNLGRSVFYGKVKTMVGLSPVDFLRQLRMQRAEELLAKSSMGISQVAYAVGFADPKYFSRCFKKDTGLTPSEYREQKK